VGEDLRTLLKSFPYLLRKKGTLTGIKQCIQLFFKIIDKTRAVEVSVVNNEISTTDLNYNLTKQVYVVNINILSKKFDITLLTEMLKYIILAGYGLKYYFYTPNEFKTAIFQEDTINIVFVKSIDNSKVRNHNLDGKVNDDSELVNNVNTTTILNNSEITTAYNNSSQQTYNGKYEYKKVYHITSEENKEDE
jgi:hypothetical protein